MTCKKLNLILCVFYISFSTIANAGFFDFIKRHPKATTAVSIAITAAYLFYKSNNNSVQEETKLMKENVSQEVVPEEVVEESVKAQIDEEEYYKKIMQDDLIYEINSLPKITRHLTRINIDDLIKDINRPVYPNLGITLFMIVTDTHYDLPEDALKLTKLLLSYGADPDITIPNNQYTREQIPGKIGKNALNLAQDNNYVDLVDIINKYKRDNSLIHRVLSKLLEI